MVQRWTTDWKTGIPVIDVRLHLWEPASLMSRSKRDMAFSDFKSEELFQPPDAGFVSMCWVAHCAPACLPRAWLCIRRWDTAPTRLILLNSSDFDDPVPLDLKSGTVLAHQVHSENFSQRAWWLCSRT